MLTSSSLEILKVLSESGGFTTGQVSKLANFSWGGNARQKSGAVRSWLNQLMREGYVRLLDDQKPTCWCRTPEGTAAINNFTR